MTLALAFAGDTKELRTTKLDKMEGKTIKSKKRKGKHEKKKRHVLPEFTNPWPYADNLHPLPEALKLDRDSLSELACQNEYIIESDHKMENDSNDQIYHLFGELINKDPGFMRQWVRLFTITHKRYLETLAMNYLASSDLSLINWCKGVKSGDRADVLVLFVLCVLTGTHCFIHLKQGHWTSLKDAPATHLEYVQCCNVYLSYLGNGIFAEHELHTVKATYKIFGLDQPIEIDETEQLVIGTLTITENKTLDKLMELTCTGNAEIASSTTIDEDITQKKTKLGMNPF